MCVCVCGMCMCIRALGVADVFRPYASCKAGFAVFAENQSRCSIGRYRARHGTCMYAPLTSVRECACNSIILICD